MIYIKEEAKLLLFYVTLVSMIQNGRNDESEPFINNSNAITKERKA